MMSIGESEGCSRERFGSGFIGCTFLTLSGITAMLGGLTLQGCGEDGTVVLDNAPRVASIVVSPDTAAVFSVGETAQFSAVALTSAGSDIAGVAFEWSSSDRNIASVSQDGEVTGHASGAVTITATASDVAGTATLLVDPDLVLQNYCSRCHRGFHVLTFETVSCPACHSVTVDPRRDENHHLVLNGHGSASAGFDLMGAHVQLGCDGCHDPETAEPAFDVTSQTDCFVCHASDYEEQHGGSGFPTACVGCHSMDEWTGATFDHEQVSGGFELLGVHTQLSCTTCHDANGAPIYAPANDEDCIACHSDDYDREHADSGYPTTCLTCHNVDSFAGASFNHDAQYFPIYSGTHRNKWSGCNTCHTNSNDYSVFTCFNCHRHDEERADRDHEGVSGYVYESSQCLVCHPDGNE